MATEGPPDPTADEANGEVKISKRAAEKAKKKAEKALKKAEHTAAAVKPSDSKKTDAKPPSKDSQAPAEPERSPFAVGFLKDVYEIEPCGAQVQTRFPPEPNGFLHIGHAKAIFVNFGFAAYHGGKCNLRFDDTNPAAEEELYFKSIQESVEWLGYTPAALTHSSDNFDRLYALAEKLIDKDKAYICHCTKEEISAAKGNRDNAPREACQHRSRPTAESLEEFRRMREGAYRPGEAVLRMKQDLASANPYMWDLPAYRIVERAHHRTQDKWRIYPTYDFTHCLCDAFEGVSHSLCTAEFRTARESYDWLLHQLADDLPRPLPQQREFGRLNVTGTVLSKRKILKLVADGVVRGWDDPRLFSVIALRRRGVPSGALRAFVAELGVSDALAVIQTVRLDTTVRKYLERTVPRLMLVLDPVRVVIDNLPEDYIEDIELEFMRGDAAMGSHTVPFTRIVYIDRSDFRETDSADFFRLAPGKTVGLLNVPYPILATDVDRDAQGNVSTIHAKILDPKVERDAPEKPNKPKAFIQWVADAPARRSPVRAEVRIFNPLFKSLNPDAVEGGYMNDLAPNSEEVYKNAVVETGFEEIRKRAPWPTEETVGADGRAASKVSGGEASKKAAGPWGVRFQGMRVAYFALDTDSTEDKVVLNKIVSLKEDAAKSAGETSLPLREK